MKLNYKNILVVRKTPKLNYLLRKLDINKIKQSVEYEVLLNGATQHEENSESFINCLKKYEKKLFNNLDIINDFSLITDNKIQDNIDIDFKEYDLIFSLGGDGTFLRTAYFINESNNLLVGVNTDSDNSHGYFCALNRLNIKNNLEETLENLFLNNFNERLFDRHLVTIQNKRKYPFINDIFFGEKHLGSVSKFALTVDEMNIRDQIIKSSGIICSTYHGYSGWIKNSNSITKKKFNKLLKSIQKEVKSLEMSLLSEQQKLELYNMDYFPEYQDKNSIFYHVREPHISIKLKNNLTSVDLYLDYLKSLEGVNRKMKIQNFGFDAFVILDGFFEVPVYYHDIIDIQTTDKKLRTIQKL